MSKFKNEAELLATFSNPNYPGCEQYRHPFLNERNGQVWATDGHVLISVAPHRLSGDYPKLKLGDPVGFAVHTCDMTVTMSMLEETLASVPKIKEQIEVQPARECEECDGTGEVMWEYTDGGLRVHQMEAVCPVCDGKGIFEKAVYKETGRTIPDQKARIEVGNAIILVRDIQRMVSAMEFFHADSVRLVRDECQTTWVIDEDIFIILMSVIENGDPVTKLKKGGES